MLTPNVGLVAAAADWNVVFAPAGEGKREDMLIRISVLFFVLNYLLTILAVNFARIETFFPNP